MDYDDDGKPFGFRMDKFALHRMETALSGGSERDSVLPVELFWQAWRPQYQYLESFGEWPPRDLDENPPDLSPGDENEFLERLAKLERACPNPPYTPDNEKWRNGPNVEQFNVGSRYIHIAAASALRHLKRVGYADDYVSQTLVEVRRVLYLLGLGPADSLRYEDLLAYLGVPDTSEDMISLWGIRALIHAVLSTVKLTDGKYEEAFMLAVDAAMLSDSIAEAVSLNEEFLVERGVVNDDNLEEDKKVRAAVQRCSPIMNLTPQQVVDAFEGLKRQGKSDSWWWVALYCDSMIWHNRENLEVEEVQDHDGEVHFWPDYWNYAKGRAREQLSPNEYREMRLQDERDASEQRLQRYFFGETWQNIPEKARERLINVDTLWFSESRGLDYGSILNDLQVAAETMCHEFIWEPLLQAHGGQEQFDFSKLDIEPIEGGKSPTLAQYIRVCESPYFNTYLRNQGLNDEEEFLASVLPTSLQYLLNFRNAAQHDPKKRMRRDEVEPFVRRFLGIGREETMRRLAELGPRLARR